MKVGWPKTFKEFSPWHWIALGMIVYYVVRYEQKSSAASAEGVRSSVG